VLTYPHDNNLIHIYKLQGADAKFTVAFLINRFKSRLSSGVLCSLSLFDLTRGCEQTFSITIKITQDMCVYCVCVEVRRDLVDRERDRKIKENCRLEMANDASH
jgi:hypothetical protein